MWLCSHLLERKKSQYMGGGGRILRHLSVIFALTLFLNVNTASAWHWEPERIEGIVRVSADLCESSYPSVIDSLRIGASLAQYDYGEGLSTAQADISLLGTVFTLTGHFETPMNLTGCGGDSYMRSCIGLRLVADPGDGAEAYVDFSYSVEYAGNAFVGNCWAQGDVVLGGSLVADLDYSESEPESVNSIIGPLNDGDILQILGPLDPDPGPGFAQWAMYAAQTGHTLDLSIQAKILDNISAVAFPNLEQSSPQNLGNFPNPFNPQTTISFDMPEALPVRLAVYDISGRLMEVLLNDDMAHQGRNQVIWQGRDQSGRQFPSGTYFYRLKAGGYVETKRMTLLK
jgi:hypothetical protein